MWAVGWKGREKKNRARRCRVTPMWVAREHRAERSSGKEQIYVAKVSNKPGCISPLDLCPLRWYSPFVSCPALTYSLTLSEPLETQIQVCIYMIISRALISTISLYLTTHPLTTLSPGGSFNLYYYYMYRDIISDPLCQESTPDSNLSLTLHTFYSTVLSLISLKIYLIKELKFKSQEKLI